MSDLRAVGSFATGSRKQPRPGENLLIDLKRSANGGFIVTETRRLPKGASLPMYPAEPKTLTFGSFADVHAYLRQALGAAPATKPTRPSPRAGTERRRRDQLTVRGLVRRRYS